MQTGGFSDGIGWVSGTIIPISPLLVGWWVDPGGNVTVRVRLLVFSKIKYQQEDYPANKGWIAVKENSSWNWNIANC